MYIESILKRWAMGSQSIIRYTCVKKDFATKALVYPLFSYVCYNVYSKGEHDNRTLLLFVMFCYDLDLIH